MPFTPLHLGPGAAFKSLAPGYLSFTIFAFVQVVIDIEPLYYMLQSTWPVHRLFHTYLGVSIPVVIGIAIGRPICEWWLRLWNGLLDERQARYFSFKPAIDLRSAVIGAAVGGYSHVALDSVMHSDVRPFAPFAEGGSMVGLITIEQLHMLCVVLGVIGVTLLALFGWLRLKRAV